MPKRRKSDFWAIRRKASGQLFVAPLDDIAVGQELPDDVIAPNSTKSLANLELILMMYHERGTEVDFGGGMEVAK
jgi:hypothetical protein